MSLVMNEDDKPTKIDISSCGDLIHLHIFDINGVGQHLHKKDGLSILIFNGNVSIRHLSIPDARYDCNVDDFTINRIHYDNRNQEQTQLKYLLKNGNS